MMLITNKEAYYEVSQKKNSSREQHLVQWYLYERLKTSIIHLEKKTENSGSQQMQEENFMKVWSTFSVTACQNQLKQ